jgi:hypothetical protein
MAATTSWPVTAPVWSSASWIANARPRPILLLAAASMVPFAGLRTALPKRSPTTASTACHSACVKASSGTATIVITYPVMVIGHGRRVRSAGGPVANRRRSATASPAPLTTPTTAPLAPNVAKYGLTTDRAPS